MRITAILSALLLSVLLPIAGHAETFKTPRALLKALYTSDVDTDTDAPSVYSAYFSDRLNALFQADLDKTEPGDSGSVDFDPVIAGQDGEASNLEIGQPIVIGNTAELEVSFTNGEPVTLYYNLVREHGGWKVDDISQQQGEYPWNLSSLLEGAQ